MPILSQKKIYIHMPKTGGSWVTELLTRELGGTKLGIHHGHASFDRLRGHELKGNTLWGTIRDPWSWYHSWWRHAMKAGQEDALLVYGGGSTKFEDVLQGMLSKDPGRCPEQCAVIWSLPKEKESRWEFLKEDGGLYSWAFSHMYRDQVKTLVDIRRLHDGVEEIFNIPTDTDSHPPVNGKGMDKKLKKHFSDTMLNDVLEADGNLISHLGYEGPGSSLKKAVLRL
jgi:hypothetical protein